MSYKKGKKIKIICAIFVVILAVILFVSFSAARGANIRATGLISGDQSSATNNTIYLQKLIDDVSENGGGRITIPNGTYYFDAIRQGSGYKNRYGDSGEYYVIKCRDNVEICGDSQNGTVLCPIGTYSAGIDMFFYKDFSSSKYLVNADFRNFTIDEQYARYSGSYDTSGKGFMINLFEKCDWENVTVKNTRGTGFGMDCPIDCTVKNCTAINCGTGVTSASSGGGSGFGIGTGYSSIESIIIENCNAENNGKFGFFFEHQSRFQTLYKAVTSKNFTVRNCIASQNMYNFGGLRAMDLTFENCTSRNPDYEDFHFSQNCRRIHLANNHVNTTFSDVRNTSLYYYNAVYWAKGCGVTYGVTNGKFNATSYLTREQAVMFLYRLAEYPGNMVLGRNADIKSRGLVNTGFSDVDSRFTDNNSDDNNYIAGTAAAINWAKNRGITNGTSQTKFSPDTACTRASFITFLYRYAGSPAVYGTSAFADVKDSSQYYYKPVVWGDKIGIIEGTGNSMFKPDSSITRADAITMLYRYATLSSGVKFNITYNLNGGSASNPSTYTSGASFRLNNPTKSGYTFKGWTGSNSSTPSTNVSISRTFRGNLVYTANWVPQYTVTFDANGGSVSNRYLTRNDGDVIGSFPSATRPGYILEGWYAHPTENVKGSNGTILDSKYDTSFKVHNNLTLYAHWKLNPSTPYKVVHQQMGLDGRSYVTVETQNLKGITNDSVTPAVKSYPGFTSPSPQTVKISADGSTTVTYRYTRNKYQFTIGSCEGVTTEGSSVTGIYYYGSTISLRATLIDGYRWIRWSNNDTKQSTTFRMPAGAVSVSPIAEKMQYRITYNTQGGTITGQRTTYTVTDDSFTLVVPTRKGYIFKGWTGSNGSIPQIYVTINKGSTGDKNYIANWEENTSPFKVIHQQMGLDGKSYTTVETENLKAEPDSVVTPRVKSYPGFTSPSPQTVKVEKDGSTTVVYRYIRNKYRFTLGSCEGVITRNSSATGDYYYGERITLNATVLNGYTWNKWSLNDSRPSITFEMPASSIVVNPIATKNIYNIIYDTQGGIISGEKTTYTVTDEDFTLVLPTRKGYIFMGWTGSNGSNPQMIVKINKGTTGDKKYIANWAVAGAASYKVIHQQMGLDGVTYTTVDVDDLMGVEDDIVTPGVKSYVGFTSPDAQTVRIASDGSTTVVYRYTRNKYRFTLGSCEGVTTEGSSATGDYYYGETITLRARAEAGYTWNKWSIDHSEQDITFKMPAGDVTINPIANKNIYRIAYDTQGGTMDEPKTTYTVTDDDFTLVRPYREGYTFLGWTGSNGSDPQVYVTIKKGSIENLTYMANWKEDVIVPETTEVTIKYIDVNSKMQLLNSKKHTFEAGDAFDYSEYSYEINGYKCIENKENDFTEVVRYYAKIVNLKINITDADSKQVLAEPIELNGLEGDEYDLTYILNNLENYNSSINREILKGKLSADQQEINLQLTYGKDEENDPSKDKEGVGGDKDNDDKGESGGNNDDKGQQDGSDDKNKNNSDNGNSQKTNDEQNQNNNTKKEQPGIGANKEDNTVARDPIPQTGERNVIIFVIVILSIVSGGMYMNYVKASK